MCLKKTSIHPISSKLDNMSLSRLASVFAVSFIWPLGCAATFRRMVALAEVGPLAITGGNPCAAASPIPVVETIPVLCVDNIFTQWL